MKLVRFSSVVSTTLLVHAIFFIYHTFDHFHQMDGSDYPIQSCHVQKASKRHKLFTNQHSPEPHRMYVSFPLPLLLPSLHRSLEKTAAEKKKKTTIEPLTLLRPSLISSHLISSHRDNRAWMKRKKWTEEEESTLISAYAELQRSGALAKLKKREKKFEPIAQRVNAVHHIANPTSFPFRWTWQDVSVKVQNMRHQFLNVKQKIRILSPTSDSTSSFNWADGENHWQNFLNYKDVFGDLDLDTDPTLPVLPPPPPPPPPPSSNDAHHSNGGDGDDDGEHEDDKDQASASALLVVDDEEAAVFGYDGFVDGDGSDVLALGLDMDCEDGFEADRDEEFEPAVSDGEERDGGEDGENGELGFAREVKRAKKGGEDWGGGRVLELREMMVRREERRREREFRREDEDVVREDRRREKEREKEERMSAREFELWERERMWARREFERRMRVEEELEKEKRWRMELEEKREEEEMEWREQMVGMQLEHEKKMMEMHVVACHNQLQVLGVLTRLVSQFFGPGGDGLGGAMGGLPLQNLQHPGSLVGENGKADGNSGAHFM